MKKYLDLSLGYAIVAIVGGVFYREFTKWNQFFGVTALGKVHTHLFLLGMVIFMIVALFVKNSKLEEQKSFKKFMLTYNIGLPLMAIMLVVRGVLQVLDTPISSKVNAMISGVAGISHILLGAGIIFLLLSLRKEFLDN